MLFPKVSVESHAALEQAEPFAYVNLVYYIRCVNTYILARKFI
jgi:hypothetical protein